MTRMIAPILAFTSEEIWREMKHDSSADPECVLFNDIPGYDPALALSEADADKWAKIINLRDDVNKALEIARSEQGIKKNQDTDLTLYFTADGMASFKTLNLTEGELATICIVSAVKLVEGAGEGYNGTLFEGVTVKVAPAAGEKCPRCWNHDVTIGTEGHHAELCERCAAVLGE